MLAGGGLRRVALTSAKGPVCVKTRTRRFARNAIANRAATPGETCASRPKSAVRGQVLAASIGLVAFLHSLGRNSPSASRREAEYRLAGQGSAALQSLFAWRRHSP